MNKGAINRSCGSCLFWYVRQVPNGAMMVLSLNWVKPDSVLVGDRART
jgi:hypothetical protein